jgi:DNA repair protein RecO
MHHIYHTEGIILGGGSFGETGKYYNIFTHNFGMIHARAQGVRKISSKLRFLLQDFAYLKIDLVRGKNFWLITSVSKTNQLEKLSKCPQALKVLTNISNLLKRLLVGEGAQEKLFLDLLKGFSVLDKASKEDLLNIEIIIVLQILNNLGYLGEEKIFSDIIKSPWEDILVPQVSKNRSQILSKINQILQETHL